MHCYTTQSLTQVKGRVLFLGDSITDDGRYITYLNTWFKLFAPQQDVTLYNLGVSSETISGLSEQEHPFVRPCVLHRLERALKEIQPNWVVLCYGMNDAIYHPFSEKRLGEFYRGYEVALRTMHAFGAQAVVCTPTLFDPQSFAAAGHELAPKGEMDYSYLHAYEKYDAVLQRYGAFLLQHPAEQAELVIDLHTPLAQDLQLRRAQDPNTLYGDGIHPDLHGHWVIAKTLLLHMFGVQTQYGEQVLAQQDGIIFERMQKRDILLHNAWKETVGHDNPMKANVLKQADLDCAVQQIEHEIDEILAQNSALRSLQTEWNGWRLDCFYMEGFEALVLCPKTPAPGAPWLWRTEFFGAFPQTDLAMPEYGWHVVHLSIPHLFGNALAVEYMQRFYAVVRERYGLAERAALLGMSRGGLYALHYAAAYPNRVSALYLDAPVVDINSWPAGRGVGCGSPEDWQHCQKAFVNETQPEVFWEKVCEAVEVLVKAQIPLLLVAGDADDVVPYSENGERLLELYEEKGGISRSIVKPNVGHHPHGLSDVTPIVDFLRCYNAK